MELLGITMGDSSGVGPEILLNAFQRGEITCPFVAYGDTAALERYNVHGVEMRSITQPDDYREGVLNVVNSGLMSGADVTPGVINAKSGHAAREYVIAATKAALAGQIAAMVTLPMNKEATQLTDPGFTGHTELIGALCGVEDVTIMLASDQLIVTHVSTHCSLADAIARARFDRICTIIRMTSEAVLRLKPGAKIAVAGLNPHAGENGLFGDEEIREIRPAVEWAQAQGMPVDGPFPPDTVFFLAVRKKRYDAIVCMYHDQGHIPLKLLDFEAGVNVALGLPIIRTSVDHGTAFDIAGQGIASTVSLLRAIEFAQRLIRT
ncbi:4-hydroxythreonine-4-phosphate dehydrogenase PdxA [Paludibaculum fermentans]|uniref:4-hydroxythreonine-4-phosphate dehydrogenase PdxA n=1 Tax=Paludibaculum fermentans TaxID=1473598 RepID=UPI003EB8609C